MKEKISVVQYNSRKSERNSSSGGTWYMDLLFQFTVPKTRCEKVE